MRIRLLGVGVKMGIVDRGHAQSDDVIRCPETFADHEYVASWGPKYIGYLDTRAQTIGSNHKLVKSAKTYVESKRSKLN